MTREATDRISNTETITNAENAHFSCRKPASADGHAVNTLIAACPPLDTNSLYCNLLQTTHFAETCILAEMDGDIVGFISGYIPPETPETIFVWQVAVHSKARGQGLGKTMLKTLINRPACAKTTEMQTTITKDNAASWGLFQSFAKDIGGRCDDHVLFDKDIHFNGQHDSEHVLTIRF